MHISTARRLRRKGVISNELYQGTFLRSLDTQRFAAKHGRREAVVRGSRQDAHQARERDGGRERRGEASRFRDDAAEARPLAEQRVHHVLVLLPLERARHVDERAARCDEVERRREQASLRLGETGKVFRLQPKANLGVLAKRARSRARNVEKNRGEAAGRQGRAARIRAYDERLAPASGRK